MKAAPARRVTTQEDFGEEPLLSLLRQSQDSIQRLSQHACLLERRVRGGAESAELLPLAQDVKFAVEDLQILLQAARRCAVRQIVRSDDEKTELRQKG